MFSVLIFLPFHDTVTFLNEHIAVVSYQTVAVTVFHVVLSNIHAHVGVFKRAVTLLPRHGPIPCLNRTDYAQNSVSSFVFVTSVSTLLLGEVGRCVYAP